MFACDLDAAYVLFNDGDVQKYLSPANRRTRQQLKVTLEISLCVGKNAVSEFGAFVKMAIKK